MGEEQRKILSMLAEGKLTVEEAEKLLAAVDAPAPAAAGQGKGTGKVPRYLRVVVTGDKKVNVRVPVQLLKSGIRLGALLPDDAQDKVGDALERRGLSLDFKGLADAQVDEFLCTLSELEVDVDDGKETVRVFCE